ncbi:peptidoglycan DD-metalloendopeptidase family protein [Pseudolysinimonas sp.]
MHLVRVLAGALALALLPVSGILLPMPAYALRTADYPSWDDVKAARADESAAKALRDSLQSQLVVFQQEAQAAQDEADAKGVIWGEAQAAFDAQSMVTQALVDQTTEAQGKADDAFAIASQVIVEMSKGGPSSDMTPRLFTSPGSPDALLQRLEIGRFIGERYAGLYTSAIELRNAADALADQAEVAEKLLEELRAAAEKAFQEAQAAAIVAQEKLAQAERDIAEVRARLDYLARVSEETTAKYNEGIRAQYGAGAEGQISATGWTRPYVGYITSQFGGRVNPVTGAWQSQHTGVDLAGGGCGSTIRAAKAGTVTYAGWNGPSGWGNYVQIDHGDGVSTGYAHILNGGILVQVGQEVAPGQPIAQAGSTGMSTGCHLHYMVRINGDLTNPVPFMRDNGAPVG